MAKYGLVSQGYYFYTLKKSTGALPLHEAAKQGTIYIINCLSEDKINLKIQDKNGLTPLHYAAIFNQKKAYEVLLEKGSDPKIKDNMGRTPESIMYGEYEGTKALGESDSSDCSFCVMQW